MQAFYGRAADFVLSLSKTKVNARSAPPPPRFPMWNHTTDVPSKHQSTLKPGRSDHPQQSPPSPPLYFLICWTTSLMNFNVAPAVEESTAGAKRWLLLAHWHFSAVTGVSLAVQIYYRLWLGSLIYHLEVWFDSERCCLSGGIRWPARKILKFQGGVQGGNFERRWKMANSPVELQNWDRFRMFP